MQNENYMVYLSESSHGDINLSSTNIQQTLSKIAESDATSNPSLSILK